MNLRCIHLASVDPKRLADFYRTALGANTDDSRGGPDRIEIWFGEKDRGNLDDRTVYIVVNRDRGLAPRSQAACKGFEFHVSNARAEYERLLASGLAIESPPRDLPWGYRYFHIQDPDGNGIDLVQAIE